MPAKSIRAWPGGATRKTRIITTSPRSEPVLARAAASILRSTERVWVAVSPKRCGRARPARLASAGSGTVPLT